MLKLMYITNSPQIAEIVSSCGVDRVFIDLETMGKQKRQNNAEVSPHKISDVKKVKAVLKSNCELLVRINSVYDGTKAEIDEAINSGADIIMLPFYKTVSEVKTFLDLVNGRAKTCLLLETKEAADILDEVLNFAEIDEIHIGLNDLHLSLAMKFMFELLSDGTVECLAKKIKNSGKVFGFGGIAKIGDGQVPSEMILAEHYRLGSQMAILSRSFCDRNIKDSEKAKAIFKTDLKAVRDYEKTLDSKDEKFFIDNKNNLVKAVEKIVAKMQ